MTTGNFSPVSLSSLVSTLTTALKSWVTGVFAAPPAIGSITPGGVTATLINGAATQDLTITAAAAAATGKGLLISGGGGLGNANGGQVTISGGQSGNTSTGFAGTVLIAGGPNQSGSDTPGGVSLQGGAATAGNVNGGDVALAGGTPSGTGKAGKIQLNSAILAAALQSSTSYANDAAASAGGVAVGQFYRNGSAVSIRIT